ncbi:MAG TPA: hypothetical protein VII69_03530 [Candidatus Eremiobacteraceae bacterium]
MAERIGNAVPAPMRFELGQAPVRGETARAVLLVTVCADGAPRVAVLSPAEIKVVGDKVLHIEVRAGSTTAANLERKSKALVWCVLDAAAYSVSGTCSTSTVSRDDPSRVAFELAVQDVYRDFEPESPMIAPPTYRVP